MSLWVRAFAAAIFSRVRFRTLRATGSRQWRARIAHVLKITNCGVSGIENSFMMCNDDHVGGGRRREAACKLSDELVSLVNHYRFEFDITDAEIVGQLESIKFSILLQAHDDEDEA